MAMQDRIKQQRLRLGYTQEELAQKIGLQKSAIAKYENGRVENIKRSIILKMAHVLECTPSYLLDLDDLVEQKQEKKPDVNEDRLISVYQSLNPTGKQKLIDYAVDLSEQEKYTKDIESHTA